MFGESAWRRCYREAVYELEEELWRQRCRRRGARCWKPTRDDRSTWQSRTFDANPYCLRTLTPQELKNPLRQEQTINTERTAAESTTRVEEENAIEKFDIPESNLPQGNASGSESDVSVKVIQGALKQVFDQEPFEQSRTIQTPSMDEASVADHNEKNSTHLSPVPRDVQQQHVQDRTTELQQTWMMMDALKRKIEEVKSVIDVKTGYS